MAGTSDLPSWFADMMQRLMPDPGRIGLAVSGGSDSMALLALAAIWRKAHLCVATVDHGLRPESLHEARFVAQHAQKFGLKHTILTWGAWDGRGNLQDAARQARQALLAQWAQREKLDAVLIGHTQDDQAETFLLRLARGSGVDGLACMQPVQQSHGVIWLRPLLDMSRHDLRAWLTERDQKWVDDPSNENSDFDRIKARKLQTLLSPLGLTPARLAETAGRMREARTVLDQAADMAQNRLRRMEYGDIVFEAEAFDALPEETRYRLIARALCEVASRPYRPRLKSLQRALSVSRATLHGCLISRNRHDVRISREPRAVQTQRAELGAPWDTRWHIEPPEDVTPSQGMHIAALGDIGLAICKDRSLWCVPRQSLIASPAVWRGPQLIAAPLAGFAPEWRLRLRQSDTSHMVKRYSH